jgi:dipeptidyl aminopeptidase/acylaminoacyl peptidase
MALNTLGNQSMMMSKNRKAGWSAAAILLLCQAVAAAPVLEGPPPRDITDPKSLTSVALPGAVPVPIADLFFTRESWDAAWSADGADLIVDLNLTGRHNLWKVPVRGGFPQQLTQSDDRQMGITVSPDGAWVVYQSDPAGTEIFDLFAVPTQGGAVIDLTNTAEVTERAPRFSPDNKMLAFVQRQKKEPSFNVAVLDMGSRVVRVLTDERTAALDWAVVGFTGDGRQLIVNRANIEQTVSAVWRIDLASGAATQLTPLDKNQTYNSASDVSADGRWIALTTETRAGDRQAAVLDTATRQVTLLQPDHWEQKTTRFSADGRRLLFVSNVDGRDTVYSYDITTRQTQILPLPPGVNSDYFEHFPSFSPDGSSIVFPHESGNTPFDYWRYDIAAKTVAPITRLALASIDPTRLPSAQMVHYRSIDGTVVSALVWMPFNLARDAHAPAVVLPHGGPTGQTTDRFDRTAIALASRGYVVIAPNPRGSTGYGRAFEAANRRDLGGGDLQDEIYGAKFLTATGYVDPSRIGITGGSYGGYMTLMAVAKTPDLWAAGVEEYGIVNWFSMYERGTVDLRQYMIGILGDPVKDKAIYEAASPLTYLQNTKAPLLVLQGENDPRVPRGEAAQVVEKLQATGHVVEAHYYAAEGHGFAKRENQIDALERTVAWFDHYLK